MYQSFFGTTEYVLQNVLNYLEKILLVIVNAVFDLFDYLSGAKTIPINLPHNFLFNIIIGNTYISFLIWIFLIFALLFIARFAIKKKNRRGYFKKIAFTIFVGTVIVTSSINAVNYVFEQLDFSLNHEEKIEESISFSNDDYATMYRILVKIGNYSLNEDRNSIYNINTCFNEIRPDLELLKKSSFYNYDYVIEGDNISWQQAISKIGNSIDLSKDVALDSNNSDLTNAIIDCMENINTNGGLKPLESFTIEKSTVKDSFTFIKEFTLNESLKTKAILSFEMLLMLWPLFILALNVILKFLNIISLYLRANNIIILSQKDERKLYLFIAKYIASTLYLVLTVFLLRAFSYAVGIVINQNLLPYPEIKMLILLVMVIIGLILSELVTIHEERYVNRTSSSSACYHLVIYLATLILIFILASNLPYKFIFAGIHVATSITLTINSYGKPNYMRLYYSLRYHSVNQNFDRLDKDSELYKRKKKGYLAAVLDEAFKSLEKEEKRFISNEVYDIISYTDLKDEIICFDREYYGAVINFSFNEKSTRMIESIIDVLDRPYGINVVRFKMSYYLAIFERTIDETKKLKEKAFQILDDFEQKPYPLHGRELASFLRRFNFSDTTNNHIEKIEDENYSIWSTPHKMHFLEHYFQVDSSRYFAKSVITYPFENRNEGNWLKTLLALMGEKVVVKITPPVKNYSKAYSLISDNVKKYSNNSFTLNTYVISSVDDDSIDAKYGFEFDHLYNNQLNGYIASEISKYDPNLNSGINL